MLKILVIRIIEKQSNVFLYIGIKTFLYENEEKYIKTWYLQLHISMKIILGNINIKFQDFELFTLEKS